MQSVAETDRKIEEAGLNKETAKLVDSGVIAQVRQKRGELGDMAKNDIAATRAKQNRLLAKAKAKQKRLDQRAASAMAKQRIGTIVTNFAAQSKVVKDEAVLRKQFAVASAAIVSTTRTTVKGKLNQLKLDVDTEWKKETDPKTSSAGKIKKYIKAIGTVVEVRYAGFSGGVRSAAEDVYSFLGGTSTKDKLMDALSEAKSEYVDAVCNAAKRVSSLIERVTKECKKLIAKARDSIQFMIDTAVPLSMKTWALSQQAGFTEELQKLEGHVEDTRSQMTAELMVNAAESVQEVEQLVNSIREKAKSVLGKIADFIREFVDDPIRTIINGLLRLAGIPRAAFWRLVDKFKQVLSDIADDPKTFANNLLAALKRGFNQFFDNIAKHLLSGLLNWLFSRLHTVNVQVPNDFSLSSVITFFLQLMGITWERIRRLLAKHIGEQNVAVLERAYELIKLLMDKGPAGILDMLKEELNPKSMFDLVMKAAIDYLIEALIKKVTVRIVAMLNPAGAIILAIEAIYRVGKWIIDNAARIFKLVETVVNGAVALMKGDIGGMAKAIEKALAKLIPPVIDFLAGFLGLGGLPDKVAEVIKGLQSRVESVLDQVIAAVAKRAKALFAKLGGKDRGHTGPRDTELGKTVRFAAGKESHRIWVRRGGRDATLMVASDKPMSIAERILDWRRRARTELPDQAGQGAGRSPRQKAAALLEQVKALHSTANSEADRLAVGWDTFAKAKPSGSSPQQKQPQPPNDDKLESQEQRLAGVLRQLFELFSDGAGGGLAQRIANKIAMAHPAVQKALKRGLQRLDKQDAARYRGKDWKFVRQALIDKTTLGKLLDKPLLRQSANLYRRAIIKQAMAPARAAVKEQRAAQKPVPFADPVADNVLEDWIEAQKRAIHAASAPFARTKTVLTDQAFAANRQSATNAVLKMEFVKKLAAEKASVDPELRKAAGGPGKIVTFMKAMATSGGKVGQIDYKRFTELWGTTVNRDYLKDRLRANVKGNLHEWIPSNYIPSVIDKAATARAGAQAGKWIEAQDTMRSETEGLVYKVNQYHKVVKYGNRPAKKALSGHTGAVYIPDPDDANNQDPNDPKGKNIQSVTGQGPWHDRLRTAFEHGNTVGQVIGSIEKIFVRTIWDGKIGNVGASSTEMHQKPYFESRASTTALTLAQMGTKIATYYDKTKAAFTRWKSKLS